MARHKRHAALWPTEHAQFLVVARSLHIELMALQRMLKPQGDHYRAIGKLHGALIVSIREVTGQDPPWMTTPASGGGSRWGSQPPLE